MQTSPTRALAIATSRAALFAEMAKIGSRHAFGASIPNPTDCLRSHARVQQIQRCPTSVRAMGAAHEALFVEKTKMGSRRTNPASIITSSAFLASRACAQHTQRCPTAVRAIGAPHEALFVEKAKTGSLHANSASIPRKQKSTTHSSGPQERMLKCHFSPFCRPFKEFSTIADLARFFVNVVSFRVIIAFYPSKQLPQMWHMLFTTLKTKIKP